MKLDEIGKYKSTVKSPPARGRGLKHFSPGCLAHHEGSPPARGRGLKQPKEATP